jgi:hypothetical protein
VTKRFVVVYEAQADFTTATELADRVLLDKIDWLEEELLQYQRQWIGEEPPGSRLTWKSIPGRAREAGIRVHGHFNGEPGLPDAHAARRAIAYVLSRLGDVDAILLIRDVDDQGERQHGLEQARAVYASECTIILGVAICERECWVICGFEPANDQEEELLASEVQKLGWNPCLASYQLTAGKDDLALRSPKRVLNVLTGGDGDREGDCWRLTPLNVLIERGQHNGLAAFLEEVRVRLVPLITT